MTSKTTLRYTSHRCAEWTYLIAEVCIDLQQQSRRRGGQAREKIEPENAFCELNDYNATNDLGKFEQTRLKNIMEKHRNVGALRCYI